jgi:hypothetical protein
MYDLARAAEKESSNLRSAGLECVGQLERGESFGPGDLATWNVFKTLAIDFGAARSLEGKSIKRLLGVRLVDVRELDLLMKKKRCVK